MVNRNAGGANTNKHGLNFESNTDLSASVSRDLTGDYELVPHVFRKEDRLVKSLKLSVDVFRTDLGQKGSGQARHLVGVIAKKKLFYNVLKETTGLTNSNHNFWLPDEAFFNFDANTIFIVEKKWQQGNGSVDEKMFGFGNKRRLYQRVVDQLEMEAKPQIQVAALFNSTWFMHGKTNYQDYFDSLR
ncbi:PD-(D/E)XK nuclease superfamily protein [Lacticaseibacillus pantheris]|jgi:hypothetical protein